MLLRRCTYIYTQRLKPLVWLGYIDDIFFILTHSEKELKEFMRELNSFDTNIKFIYEYSDKKVSFLDLQVDTVEGKLIPCLFVKPNDRHQTFTIRQVILSTLNGP